MSLEIVLSHHFLFFIREIISTLRHKNSNFIPTTPKNNGRIGLCKGTNNSMN